MGKRTPATTLNSPELREFYALLELAERQCGNKVTARKMVEAYYSGQLDRERIDHEIASAAA